MRIMQKRICKTFASQAVKARTCYEDPDHSKTSKTCESGEMKAYIKPDYTEQQRQKLLKGINEREERRETNLIIKDLKDLHRSPLSTRYSYLTKNTG